MKRLFFNTKTLEKVGCRILTKTHIYYIINKFTKLSVSKKCHFFEKKNDTSWQHCQLRKFCSLFFSAVSSSMSYNYGSDWMNEKKHLTVNSTSRLIYHTSRIFFLEPLCLFFRLCLFSELFFSSAASFAPTN